FGFRPSKLFDGVNLRLTILLTTPKGDGSTRAWATRYLLWSQEERPNLFSKIRYCETGLVTAGTFPKVDDALGVSVCKKLSQSKPAIGKVLARAGGSVIHYHRSPLYWIRAMDFEPYFRS